MRNPVARLNMVVGIATAGRKEILGKAIKFLAGQSRLPDRLLICPMSPSDVDEGSVVGFPAPGGAKKLCRVTDRIVVRNESEKGPGRPTQIESFFGLPCWSK
jgi:hypothetical protein